MACCLGLTRNINRNSFASETLGRRFADKSLEHVATVVKTRCGISGRKSVFFSLKLYLLVRGAYVALV